MSRTILLLLTSCILSCTVPEKNRTYSIGQILTSHGEMFFCLYDDTPNHKESFIKLATDKYWHDYTFNRVIEGFVIQGGCPDTAEGFADFPYLIPPEFNAKIKHNYGALGAGRDGNAEKLSAGCQLYIVQNKDGLSRLDGEYMIFGQLIKGYDVLDAIAQVATDSLDRPLQNIEMEVNVVQLSKQQLSEFNFTPES